MRKIQDVPIRCKPTYLHVNACKYECDNPECETKVFTGQLSFVGTSQVRTDALNTLILGMAMFMCKEGESSVLKLLGITVSNDTIQHLYDRIRFDDDPDVEAVGIDDAAARKGQTYAAAVYDLKDHHMISLLDGRDGLTLREGLKQHKKIRVVARDRVSAYANMTIHRQRMQMETQLNTMIRHMTTAAQKKNSVQKTEKSKQRYNKTTKGNQQSQYTYQIKGRKGFG